MEKLKEELSSSCHYKVIEPDKADYRELKHGEKLAEDVEAARDNGVNFSMIHSYSGDDGGEFYIMDGATSATIAGDEEVVRYLEESLEPSTRDRVGWAVNDFLQDLL